MYYSITLVLLAFFTVSAQAKIQIPFQQINLMPVYELATEVQPPLAVSASRFILEVHKDCREFSNSMNLFRDQSVQISMSDYNDIRFRALPLSMKANYEIKLLTEKSLNLQPTFESAKITKYHLDLKFSEKAASIYEVQNNAKQYVEVLDSELQNYLVLQFKSRDLFCDYYFGNLNISLEAEIQLQTSQSVQTETEEKLKHILNNLNDSLQISANKKVQAAYIGVSTYEAAPLNWKQNVQTIFNELVNKEDLVPYPFWSEKQSNFYDLKFSRLHNISKQKIFLKGKFND